MNGGVIFLIVLIFLLLGGYGGWVLWSRIQANRLGLPPPSLNPFARGGGGGGGGGGSNYPAPAPGGIKGFFDNTIRKFKNRNNRSAAGAYEEPSGYGQTRGRGAGNRLDPDEAWSARVGDEAYYEEQELGLQGPPGGNTGYSNTPYGAPSPGFQSHQEPERGRSRNREYDEGLQVDSRSARDPFSDDHAASLRGVSPRPLDHGQDTSYGGGASIQGPVVKKVPTGGSDQNSPTERRSMFRENM
ncbi:hypothetical protein B0J11DRAFT_24851 [Dendryphion nanum]|uniref:Uncharacterized protein n=1 Tax=Dendryphion nanum TaxID=256645 RepID=A0A9P9EJH2_9PLEO|nr:hypothetical protein B0J11DRAFT_24851 [Dendryphion nanum]